MLAGGQWGFAGLFLIIKNKSIFSLFAPPRVAQRSSAHAAEAVSPASAAPPDLAHLHLLAHLAGVPTEASLSYKSSESLEARRCSPWVDFRRKLRRWVSGHRPSIPTFCSRCQHSTVSAIPCRSTCSRRSPPLVTDRRPTVPKTRLLCTFINTTSCMGPNYKHQFAMWIAGGGRT